MDHDAAIGVLEHRRAELLGELAALNRHRAKLRADLRHIEGALHQIIGQVEQQEWLPGLPRPVGGLPRRARIDRWFKGPELGRLLLDALQKAGGSASTGQLVRAVCEGRDVPSWAVPVVTSATEKTLRRFTRRGVVTAADAGLWRTD